MTKYENRVWAAAVILEGSVRVYSCILVNLCRKILFRVILCRFEFENLDFLFVLNDFMCFWKYICTV